MKLDLSLIEEVRRELETTQDITSRPILLKIIKLSKEQLNALKLLCSCEGYADIEKICSLEYIFNNEENFAKNKLENEYNYLIEQEIIGLKNDNIVFLGDDFDKIYTKYFAREQKVSLRFMKISLEQYWDIRCHAFSKGIIGQASMIHFIDIDVSLNDIIDGITAVETQDVFVDKEMLILDIYRGMVRYKNNSNIPIIHIKLNLPWLKGQSWHYMLDPADAGKIDEYYKRISILKERVEKIGGEFILEKENIDVVPMDILVNKLDKSENDFIKEIIGLEHLMILSREYCERTNAEDLLFHALLAFKFIKNNYIGINNLGYVLMAFNELEKARECFEKENGPDAKYLALYNLGVLEAKIGDYKKALINFKQVMGHIKDEIKEKRECFCLFIPKIVDGKLVLIETRGNPDIYESAREGKEIMEALISEPIKY